MVIRIDHDAMRRAAELPTSGPAATDDVAASGGLDLPGGQSHPHDAAREHAREPIPGEHDQTTLPPTEPAIVGSTGFGADLPVESVDPTIDEESARQNRWEGGGKVTKGISTTRGEGELTNPRHVVPRLGPDTEAHPGERKPDEEQRD